MPARPCTVTVVSVVVVAPSRAVPGAASPFAEHDGVAWTPVMGCVDAAGSGSRHGIPAGRWPLSHSPQALVRGC